MLCLTTNTHLCHTNIYIFIHKVTFWHLLGRIDEDIIAVSPRQDSGPNSRIYLLNPLQVALNVKLTFIHYIKIYLISS